MNHDRETKAGNKMYQKLIVFVQSLVAIGILVIAVITWMGQSTSELRIEMQEEFRSYRAEMRSFRSEMQEEFKSVRAEMRSFRNEMQEEFRTARSEMQDMNKRLGRVEGEVRALTQGRE